jgi:serine/threonine protein kinase
MDSHSDLLSPALESLALQPRVSGSNKSSEPRALVSGYAAFLDLLIRNHVPVIPERAAFLGDVRRLGIGLSFTVLTGVLKDNLNPSEFLCNDNMGERRPKYKKGANVVEKHMNFEKIYHQGSQNIEEILEPLATEALILSHPRMMMCSTLPTLIGIGCETSPYDEAETPQQWPFLLTEFGTGGNLEDVFRDAWRKQAPMGKVYEPTIGQLQANPTVNWEISLPWTSKLLMAASVANALMFSHSIGVVHGDVKFANCLWIDANAMENPKEEEKLWIIQLCDFGSSLLLSDYQEESLCELKAYSPPWNAPEVLPSSKKIKRKDLCKTDIYSFGLLFARIMLDGNDPFDEGFNVGEGRKANYDYDIIRELKMSDSMTDVVMNRVIEQGKYDDSQLAIMEMVLTLTLPLDPNVRVDSMRPISTLLKKLTEQPE